MHRICSTANLRWIGCLVIAASSVALADQVTLKNGDRVSGKVVKKDGDSILIKSDLMGEVTIKWENVTAVSTDEPVTVVTKAGKEVRGKAAVTGDQLAVADQRIPLGEVNAVRDAAEQARYERMLNPPLYDLWAGYVDVGFASASGNASSTVFTTAFKANRVTRKDEIGMYFNQIYSRGLLDGVKATTAQAVRGGWKYNRNLSPKLFVNVFNDYEYDKFQNLDLRFVIGGGLGYSVIKTERTKLDLLGGFAFNREKFSTPLNAPVPSGVEPKFTRNSGEVYWGDDFLFKLNSRVGFRQNFRMFNNLTNPGEYRVNFDVGLDTKLFSWLSWQITGSDRYLSNPSPGRKTNDLLLSSGIRITFAQAK
jgi:putative salt-induced outer membrane protein YdiY